tara:strand:+ start:293 stop:1369 length:1077 start_codon:yes stop_codon:yes gene_type:complete
MPEYYIGIMCGTSLDSLDMSLCRFGKVNQIKIFKEYKLSPTLKEHINMCKNKPNDLGLFNKADDDVTKFVTSCLNKFITSSSIKNIKAIGYPGITIKHDPKKKISKVLGNSEIISKNVQINVIGNFRLSDMKVGGEGAPLAPYFHDYISTFNKSFVNILNLGGFANLTYKSNNEIKAFDTGPANYLIDLISNKYFGIPYDKNGALSKKYKADEKALLAMLAHKYFNSPIPKSTGFETFNLKWINKYISKYKIKNKNTLIATITQLTIISISDAINSSNLDSSDIFFSGGGSRNKFIKNNILKRTGMNEVKVLPFSLNYKNLESASFAWLAMKRNNNQMIKKNHITGASRSRKLGFIYR